MLRWAYIFAVFVALTAWAGAQGPGAAPLTAADQLRLLKANGTLIDNLVDHGVELSRADTPQERAKQCRAAAKALATAIQAAATKQEAERVAELTTLFRDVLRDALLPALENGKRLVTPGSPGEEQLLRTWSYAAQDLSEVKTAIPATGKVAENARVKDAMKDIDALADKLNK